MRVSVSASTSLRTVPSTISVKLRASWSLSTTRGAASRGRKSRARSMGPDSSLGKYAMYSAKSTRSVAGVTCLRYTSIRYEITATM